jgi:PII-like signaling protein
MMKVINKFVLGIFLFISMNYVMAIEEPKYRVIDKEGAYEVRQYEPKLIAEVVVEGSRDEASNKGFRLIAAFIFGENQAVSSADSEKIAMTVPVTVDSPKEPQKIAMTAPVLIEGVHESNQWRITFVMPSKYNVNTLPRPKNSLVKIREIPEKKYAAMTFSGLLGEEKIQNNIQQLQDWIMKKGHLPNGPVELARYNPPWTLPPWRRHEILIELTP